MRWKFKTFMVFTLAVVMVAFYCIRVIMRDPTNKNKLFARNWKITGPITRDPDKKLIYSYSTGDSIRISNTSIDISKKIDLVDMDSRTVIFSGFSQANAHDGLGMITSVQSHMPNKRIIIYNLGIHPKTVKRMTAMCNVEVRIFQHKKYPSHIQQHENGAWKILALMELLMEHGVVFFAHPKIRFRAPINILFPYIKEHHGVIAKLNHENQTTDVTHPSMYRVFGLTPTNLTKNFPNTPIISGDLLLLVNNSEIYTTLLQPLIECASKRKCIAPTGSTRRDVKPVGRTHTHHYEMSAFTLLMYKNFRDEWVRDIQVHSLLSRIHQIAANGHVNDHQWAHYCNPPKKEVNCITQGGRC